MKYTSAFVTQRTDRQSARWAGYLRYKDDSGKWKQIAKTFPATVKTKRQAEKALQEWRSEMELQAAEECASLDAKTSVASYVSSYIDMIEAVGTVRPSAVADYRTSCKRISEGIGDILLCDLTTADIQAWEKDLLESGRGINTVLKYHRLLNSVCKHAISVRDLQWNPCTAVKKPKRVAPSPNSLTAEQHARLLTTLTVMEPTSLVTAATIAVYTGMREGEICGLKWKCYDAQQGILRIEKAIAKAGGKSYETEPKTDASRRTVPVHPDLAQALLRRRQMMVAQLEAASVNLTDSEFGELYVIGQVDGRYYSPTVLSKSWKELSSGFGLIGTQGRPITFHDLRHSFATRAIAAGADVKAVAAVLGHTDAHVTLNVYADADRESKQRAVSLVGSAIAEQGEVKPYAVTVEPVEAPELPEAKE